MRSRPAPPGRLEPEHRTSSSCASLSPTFCPILRPACRPRPLPVSNPWEGRIERFDTKRVTPLQQEDGVSSRKVSRCHFLALQAPICGRDYDSFTDSWLPADMNLGGRTPRSWVSCAGHDYGTTAR